MNSSKQPNEFSKLLKDNDSPRIIYRGIYRKQSPKTLFIWILHKVNDYFVLLLLILILIFSISIYLLLLSIKEKNEMLSNFDDFDDQEIINQKIYKPLNITNLYNETKMCTENKKYAIIKLYFRTFFFLAKTCRQKLY